MKVVEIEKLPEFDNHRVILFFSEFKGKLKGYIAIHRGGLNRPAFGATRLWKYNSELEALKDVLNLSRIMSYKLAIHKLKYGGAKGVILYEKYWQKRRLLLLKAYAEKINYLGGHFITGADVGLTKKDVKVMKKISPHLVGIKYDPAKFTALGLFSALSVCLKKIFGNEEISNRTFAIQGLGKVGVEFLKLIYKESKQIFVSEINEFKLRLIKKVFS
jgi:leucine dehydrogenase